MGFKRWITTRDSGVLSPEGRTVVKAVKSIPGKIKGGILATGLIAAGAVAATVIFNQSREHNRFDPSKLPSPLDDDKDLPQVPTSASLTGETLAGVPINKKGPHLARYLAQKNGLNGGVDPSNPEMADPNGLSKIDNKPIVDLNAPVAAGRV